MTGGRRVPPPRHSSFAGPLYAMPRITAALPNFLARSSIARSACGRAAVEHVGVVGLRGLAQRADAGADQAERRAVDLLRQHLAATSRRSSRRAASAPGSTASGCAGGNPRSSSFSVMVSRTSSLLFSRDDTFSRQPPQDLFQRGEIADVGLERGLVGNRLGAAIGLPRGGRRCRAPAATACGLRRRTASSARSRRRAAGRRWCGSRAAPASPAVAGPTP